VWAPHYGDTNKLFYDQRREEYRAMIAQSASTYAIADDVVDKIVAFQVALAGIQRDPLTHAGGAYVPVCDDNHTAVGDKFPVRSRTVRYLNMD